MATVIFHPFDLDQDAAVLKDAIDNLGKNDDLLIHILGNKSARWKKLIVETYKTMYKQDFRDAILSRLTGNFKKAVELLLMPLAEYYAELLYIAIYGPEKDEDLLLEIMFTIKNTQIREIKEIYRSKFEKTLEDSIQNDCQSPIKNMLLLVCKAGRNERLVYLDKWFFDTEVLVQAGKARWEMDAIDAYNILLTYESYAHLRFVFKKYELMCGWTLSEAIETETLGSMKRSLLTIVQCVENMPAYFAQKLHRVLKGPNRDLESLLRIVVSRCETDMVLIKTEYQKLFREPLEDAIAGDEPKNVEKLLVALVTR